MKSPFPGMDPYLEQHWRDVHARLVLYGCDQMQPQLGGSLRARVEERVIVDLPDDSIERNLYPDVRIIERPGPRPERIVSAGTGTLAVAEPLVISQLEESHTEGYIQILDGAAGNRVVTVIEILSPTNKRAGKDRKEYRRKRAELARGRVSLVEIDLLRGGRTTFEDPKFRVPRGQRGTYAACVHRGYEGRRYEYYGFPLRDRLPAIRIPLRKQDPDAVLNLQALIDQAYSNGAYDDIDYAKEPEPPFDAEDAACATELLKGAKRR